MNNIGNLCPVCNQIIAPGQSTVACCECGLVHHYECWVKNGGCAEQCRTKETSKEENQNKNTVGSLFAKGILDTYKKVGKKIKSTAIFLLVVGAIMSFAVGIRMLMNGLSLGILAMLGGFIVSDAITMFLYGFGELIDKVCDIEKHLSDKK